MKRKIIIALGMLIISGCASTEQKNVYKPENHIKAKNNLYATLTKDTNGNYSFDKFSFLSMKNSVNLNTLVHNYPTNESQCRAGLGEGGDVGLCSENALFSTNTIDGGDILANTLGNVIIAAGTMGLGTSAHYTAKFDHEGFNEALDEALSKIDRNKLILEANNLALKHQEKLTKAFSEFENLQLSIDKIVSNSVKVNDDSQLYLAKPQVKTIVTKKFMSRLSLSDVWVTTEELNNKLAKEVETSSNYGKISLRCDNLNNFNFKVVGCEQSWNYRTAAVVEPIKYSISSAKKYIFYPTIKAIDKNVTISSTSTGQIEVVNNTNSFITLSSLSFYLGTDIETLSNLDLELPPGAVSRKLSMNEFKIYSKNRTLNSIVKKDLNKNIAIGLATKYKIIETNVEKTIYKKSNYKYSELRGDVI